MNDWLLAATDPWPIVVGILGLLATISVAIIKLVPRKPNGAEERNSRELSKIDRRMTIMEVKMLHIREDLDELLGRRPRQQRDGDSDDE